MKTIKYLLTTFLFLLLVGFSLQAQNTSGTDFWLTFGTIFDNSSSSYLDMQIRIVNGDKQTTGTIFFTNLGDGYSIDFEIDPYGIFDRPLNTTEKAAVYNTVMGTNNHSARITTSNPVTVYAFTQFSQWGDASNILPVTALGTEYYQMSHMVAWAVPNSEAYAVIATQNNTQLFHDKTYITTLSAGQVYFRTSNTDMTGVYVNSDKPIAFIVLNKCTCIPLGWGHPSNIMQQLAPISTWGKIFFVPVTKFEKEIVRIVVAHNGTNITKTGGTIRTDAGGQALLTSLQAGQYVELEISLGEKGCYIEADSPVGVCSYMVTKEYSGFLSAPSQTWIPALEQSIPKALIAPFKPSMPSGLFEHYALISTPTASKNNTTVSIGGAPPTNLGGVVWHDHSKGTSFCSFPLSNLTSSYHFTNPNGMIILGYGDGPYQTASVSYYYLSGSAMRDLDAAFYANDIHFQDLKDNPICENLITFRAEIEGLAPPTVAERIKWYVNEEHQPAGFNQLTWQRSFTPGNYDVRMWVRYENDDTVSKTGTLKICSLDAGFYVNNVPHYVDTTFCNKKVYFHTEVETSTEPGHIRWYIDYNDGNGYVEEPAAFDQKQWNKTFESGTYPIKMWVLFPNGEDATITSMLKIQTLWINIKNVRY